MSFAAVGKAWEGAADLAVYLDSLRVKPVWAKAVTLHHTAAPSLKTRPTGLTDQHMLNIRNFYRDEKGWASGPHFFVDDHRILGMTPVNEFGIHAVSFNRTAIGIEVLGDYDSEDPKAGRGLIAWQRAAAVTKVLLDWLGLPMNAQTVLFHRDDKKTTKSCPGGRVKKDWVLELMGAAA